MRILFAGNPKIALPSLAAAASLEDAGIELACVLTSPDRPGRRGGNAEPSAVSAAASILSETRRRRGLPPIPQCKPERLDPAAQAAVAEAAPDLLVSFAYGRIFSAGFLGRFPLGGINIHPSLLPRYRGAAPIPAAILHGDKETGVTIQALAPGLDAGDILAQEKIPLNRRETAASLSGIAGEKAAALLSRTLLHIRDTGLLRGVPQRGDASYCSCIRKEDGVVDWSSPALAIDAKIRAFTPWPLSWTYHKGRRLFVLEASPAGGGGAAAAPGAVLGVDAARGILVQTGGGVLGLTRLQYQAKKALDFRPFLNGARDILGAALG
ncbi:MAG: methionyl-tRNA formyltransferase [Spirochaetaceae bacterium]|jgi:methionyl-tRNA formyltransferase|nr:methionyl-tRNA formyltransferase [Spirochaetaceae bacterium]